MRKQPCLTKFYRIANMFTNELGKNSISIGGIGTNSTCDEVVVLFERPVLNF